MTRAEQAAETRTRLLDTAAALFARDGLAATGARDVAREAGVAVGTLYLHFGDKDGLLEAVLVDAFETLSATFDEGFARMLEGGERGLDPFARALAELLERDTDRARLVFSDEVAATGPGRRFFARVRATNTERLAAGVAAGVFGEDVDPVVTGRMLLGLTVEVARHWLDEPGPIAAPLARAWEALLGV